MTQETHEHAQWCQGLFATLAEGGTWIVPRSGLVFKKHANTLTLTGRLPDFPRAFQEADAECIKAHFEAAGISVRL